jgi:PAT family acetyl-CoA transporter-like MFS transporter 1
MCVLVGAITFVMFIRPQALKLQSLPMRAWRIAEN